MPLLIDGKKIAEKIKAQVAGKIKKIKTKPRFAVIQVGDNPASTVYVRNKIKACHKIGIETVNANLDMDVSESNLIGLIEGFNNSSSFNGILVQLPLPEQIRLEPVIEVLSPDKDVDGLHPLNVGRLTVHSKKPYLRPCTAWGIVHMLDTVFPKEGKISGLRGKKTVVIGQSLIVGRPLSIMLQNEGATVSMCDRFTADLKNEVSGADIIISATGVAGLINKELVEATGKKDLTIIDAGITRVNDKIVGDADPVLYNDQKIKAITPVPGGVGPVTIAFLMRNILKAYYIQNNLDMPVFD